MEEFSSFFTGIVTGLPCYPISGPRVCWSPSVYSLSFSHSRLCQGCYIAVPSILQDDLDAK